MGLINWYLFHPKMKFIYGVILIYAFNPFGMGTLIPMVLLPYVLINQLGLRKNKQLVLAMGILFLFTLSYSAIGLYYGFFPVRRLLQVFVYPLLFLWLGFLIMKKRSTKEEKFRVFKASLSTFAYAFGAFAVLSFFRTMLLFGSVEGARKFMGGRIVLGLWNEKMPATLFAAYLSLGIVLIPQYFLQGFLKGETFFTRMPAESQLSFRRRWVRNLLLGVLFLSSVTSALMMGSRTIILIVFVSVVLTLVAFEKKRILKRLGLISVSLSLIFFMAFTLNIGQFKYWIKGFSLGSASLPERLIASVIYGDTRVYAWGRVVRGMFNYPFGGRMTRIPLKFAHNLWLDVAWDTGVIPFTLLAVFTSIVFASVVKVVYKTKDTYLRGVILQVTAVLGIIFLFEPTLQMIPSFFVVFCFFGGMIFNLDEEFTGCEKMEEAK